ncbi:lytic transglycosylase domain-containing protein [Telluribacter sp. SYSU D00476]|uniref:lytic transglycosylase domain-containing protein n=1 Tax=Telluribacter sp. SYSU D00476 TaxID=2811430 RepID=UPI001FF12E4F|nr:lytic transglycosylase domain-containing protein [Telluribacter sp. SYSU D00476]
MRYIFFFGLLFCISCSSRDKSSGSEQKDSVVTKANFGTDAPDRPQYVSMPPIPKDLTFAGERVPLERDDVREGLEQELIINTFRHSNTIFILKRIERWRPLIEKTLQENGVPTDFIYLAVAESEFQNTARSYAGAVGMWQFMPATARDYGLTINSDVDMRKDPKLATEAASRYLKWAYRNLNSWSLVAASYNRGVSGVKGVLDVQKTNNFWDLYLNPETARYVYRLIAFKLIMENPQAYGYFIRPEDQYKPYRFKTVRVEKGINLIDFAKQHNSTYKELRELNPWFSNTSNYYLPASAKGYEIRVPDRGEEAAD